MQKTMQYFYPDAINNMPHGAQHPRAPHDVVEPMARIDPRLPIPEGWEAVSLGCGLYVAQDGRLMEAQCLALNGIAQDALARGGFSVLIRAAPLPDDTSCTRHAVKNVVTAVYPYRPYSDGNGDGAEISDEVRAAQADPLYALAPLTLGTFSDMDGKRMGAISYWLNPAAMEASREGDWSGLVAEYLGLPPVLGKATGIRLTRHACGEVATVVRPL